jgi:acetoin utilization deacetylase AcuC-like enzyme
MGLISFLHHNNFRLHENPGTHPESPARLSAIDRAIVESEIALSLVSLAPRVAQNSDLASIHSQSYLDLVEKAARLAKAENKIIQMDGDTFMNQKTYDVAKLAVGAGFTAIDSLERDDISSAFVAVRPPGHHAMAQKQMGFCIFNNIALAAEYARKHLGHKKVLIIDWDVHHGNGTQDIFYNDPGVFFISMHQYPHWPYETGWLTEDGAGEGKGYNMNIPLPAGTGDEGHLKAWDSLIIPVSKEFKPDIILVSAGYDAHQNDHMSSQNVTTNGFGLLASRLQDLANKLDVKTACFLEGGYNTAALADSVVATLGALSKNPNALAIDPERISNDSAPKELAERLSSVQKHFSQYWSSLK